MTQLLKKVALIGRCGPFTWRVRWGVPDSSAVRAGGERQITDGAERVDAVRVCRICASNGRLRPDLRPPRSQMSRTSVLSSISGCIKTGSFTCRNWPSVSWWKCPPASFWPCPVNTTKPFSAEALGSALRRKFPRPGDDERHVKADLI